MEFQLPGSTVDAIAEHNGKVLLIRRGKDPFKDKLALPGGFVDYGKETVEEAVLRELEEETGISGTVITILGVYSHPKRDPRRHTISTVFIVDPAATNVRGGDDAAEADWFDLDALKEEDLAFDHALILKHYREYKKKAQTCWSTKTLQ